MAERNDWIDGRRALQHTLRVLRQHHRRGVATVAPAVGADARRIDEAELVAQIRQHAQLVLDLDGAEVALDLGAQSFALAAAATAVDLRNDHRALAAQVPVPVDVEPLADQLRAGRCVAARTESMEVIIRMGFALLEHGNVSEILI